ncbi:tyrosine-protein phosphatase [Paenibacillus roseipurpureus]|uniref:Tyrosine-protein phosphatase n=1 Tax=Paenibacillus roseopurpureus TaxID=2918901 RepID=A0AA96RJY9_9BACL|nr:CpsB/CapC family capsule biosynthesis tyrosine phosphatase [Paenibacillus sp. MBLB1832]WNR43774.1 tyrosine protein phosphatase [Paenibacillus sp. MBLB1832]
MLIDTHCHILPWLDDGAESMQEAIAMAKCAAKEGIRTIVATPHYGDGKYDNPAELVDLAVHQLNAELEKQEVPVQILPGQEVRVYKELLDDLEAGYIQTLNKSQYLLLEMPHSGIPDYFDDLLYEIHVLGLTVIIAHPERNTELMKNPRRLHYLIEQGCLSQVTSQSITGLFGRKIQKFAIHLCKRNMVHLIASDAHNLTTRPGTLSLALADLASQLNHQIVEHYSVNALRVVRNETILLEPISYPRRVWLFM